MLLICNICKIGLPQDQEECPMCKLKAVNGCLRLSNLAFRGDIKLIESREKELRAKRDALRKALKDCRDTLVLCTLIDKSGQAQKSALLAEQALKGVKDGITETHI